MSKQVCDYTDIEIGDVFWTTIKAGDVEKKRPVVVYQNNVGNYFSSNVVVLPITSVLKKLDLPTHVLLLSKDTPLKRDGIVQCENPVSVPKESLIERVGHLSDHYIEEVVIASTLASSGISFLSPKKLFSVWEQSMSYNKKLI